MRVMSAIGLVILLGISAAIAQTTTVKPSEQAPPVQWEWPAAVSPKARLVAAETRIESHIPEFPTLIFLTFQEPSGAVKLLVIRTDVQPGRLVPQRYRVYALTPR